MKSDRQTYSQNLLQFYLIIQVYLLYKTQILPQVDLLHFSLF